ncbi:MAG: peptidylprolyl isomerase [Anaerolineales bacterium]|nr:peptidylprolyl isomerase [Anaerolineales bacterium]
MNPVIARLSRGMQALLFALLLYNLTACTSGNQLVEAEPTRVRPTNTSVPASPDPTSTPTPLSLDYPLPTWSLGAIQAPVVFTIYGDYQSPPAAALDVILTQLLALHPGELKIEYRHFPLATIHDKSLIAVLAAEAAGQQDHFWDMHTWLYQNQNIWSSDDPQAFVERLLDVAENMGLDRDLFRKAITDSQLQARVEATFSHAIRLDILSVPYIEINDEPFVLPSTLENLEAYYQLARAATRQYEAYPPDLFDLEDILIVTIVLDNGAEIMIQLFPESAPLAVNSFLFLAQEGWYDGCGFYSVVPGIQVESGDPSHTGIGDPGYHFLTEIDPVRSFNQAGMLAMITRGPDANGSAFFITLTPRSELNGTRTIFGQVLEGLEQLESLPARSPLEDILEPLPLRITSITIH